MTDTEIRPMLELSTAHVPGPEPDWGDLKVKVHEYGWVVWVYDPDDNLSPDWMKPIMKLAYQKNCVLILFDSDADEWEDTELHKMARFGGLWEGEGHSSSRKGVGVGECPEHGEYFLDAEDSPCPSCEEEA